MMQVWLLNGDICSFMDTETQALSFHLQSREELETLLRFAKRDGYSVGIEYIDDPYAGE